MATEVNHSPPYSAEVKNEWSYTSTPHIPSWPGQGKIYLYPLGVFATGNKK
jgi:hypothetical protein